MKWKIITLFRTGLNLGMLLVYYQCSSAYTKQYVHNGKYFSLYIQFDLHTCVFFTDVEKNC